MYLSISDELQLFAEELYEHLTPSFLGNLARELGFVKRKRKFSGYMSKMNFLNTFETEQ
ncbi:transposase for insertion sequence element IS231C [Bacillus cereus BAG2X1-1]|nr:transposase for insertion sequence element IS231C [Bacillus cereus BAG2X1-1]